MPARRERICVFISHKDADPLAAIKIGSRIMQDQGLDVYIDIYNKSLQIVDEDGDLGQYRTEKSAKYRRV